MTTITLNLLAEEQLAQEASARDPLKWAVAISAFAITLTVVCGVTLSMIASRKKADLGRLQEHWDELSGSGKGSGGISEEIQVMAGDFVAINHSRTPFAPQLAIIKNLVTDSVQLTHLNLSTKTELLGTTHNPPDEDATEGNHKHRRATVARSVDRIVMQIDGKCTAKRPEVEIDAFIQALRHDPEFSPLVEQVQLLALARAPAPADGTAADLPTANFVIECHYRERQ